MRFPACPICKKARRIPRGKDFIRYQNTKAKWAGVLVSKEIPHDEWCGKCICDMAKWVDNHKFTGDIAVTCFVLQKIKRFNAIRINRRQDSVARSSRPVPSCIDCSIQMPGRPQHALRCARCRRINDTKQQLMRKTDEFRKKDAERARKERAEKYKIRPHIKYCAGCGKGLPRDISNSHRKWCVDCFPVNCSTSRLVKLVGGPQLPRGKCDSCGGEMRLFAVNLKPNVAHWCVKCQTENPLGYHQAEYQMKREKLLVKRNCVGCGLQLAGTRSHKWCGDCWKKDRRRRAKERYHKLHDNA